MYANIPSSVSSFLFDTICRNKSFRNIFFIETILNVISGNTHVFMPMAYTKWHNFFRKHCDNIVKAMWLFLCQ